MPIPSAQFGSFPYRLLSCFHSHLTTDHCGVRRADIDEAEAITSLPSKEPLFYQASQDETEANITSHSSGRRQPMRQFRNAGNVARTCEGDTFCSVFSCRWAEFPWRNGEKGDMRMRRAGIQRWNRNQRRCQIYTEASETRRETIPNADVATETVTRDR